MGKLDFGSSVLQQLGLLRRGVVEVVEQRVLEEGDVKMGAYFGQFR